MTKQILLLPTLLTVLSAGMIWAGCVSDCKDEYDSAVESCKLLYDEPADADDLRLCIRAARDDYQSCIDDCD